MMNVCHDKTASKASSELQGLALAPLRIPEQYKKEPYPPSLRGQLYKQFATIK